MTSTPLEENLEPFGSHVACANSECQAMYQQYKVIYEKYFEQLQRLHAQMHENQLLAFDVKHKIAFLELNKNQLGQMVEQQTRIADILQHKVRVSDIDGGSHSVCDGCMHHRAALITQRLLNANNYPNIKANQDECQRVLEASREELRAEKLINAKLRIRIGVNADPFWKDREVLQLRGEVAHYKALCTETNEQAERLKGEMEVHRQRLVNSEHMIEILESELARAGAKRKAIDEDRPVAMDEGLARRFHSVFSIPDSSGGEIEEYVLYDAFRATIREDELDDCFEAMYGACHSGERLSSRDRRHLSQGGTRVCKSPFGACLKALGGTSKKRGTLTVWTNVALKKAGV